MPLMTRFPSRLLMQNMHNVRDIGGFATTDGKMTAFGRFLRADAPVRLNSDEIRLLEEYQLGAVIDLRSPSEIKTAPYALNQLGGIEYINIPLLGNDLELGIAEVKPSKPGTESILADLYIHMLEHAKSELGQIFRLISRTPAKPILFHCTHGKDRTGLVAALLLLLAKVSESDIIANYQVSFTYLKPYFDQIRKSIPDRIWPFLNSDPENMEKTLLYLTEQYSSVDRYLESCDVGDFQRSAIIERLLA